VLALCRSRRGTPRDRQMISIEKGGLSEVLLGRVRSRTKSSSSSLSVRDSYTPERANDIPIRNPSRDAHQGRLLSILRICVFCQCGPWF